MAHPFFDTEVIKAQIPREGPRAAPFQIPFDGTLSYDLNMLLTTGQRFLSVIVMVWCDNSANTQNVVLVASVLNQRLVFPAGSQAYLPLLVAQNATLHLESGGAAIVQFTPLNVPTPAIVWPRGSVPPPAGNFRITMANELRITLTGDARIISIAPPPPVFTSPPFITGSGVEGATLTGHVGVVSNADGFLYAWTLDGAPIGGATAITYTPLHTDVGHNVIFAPTAFNVTNSVQAFSAPVTITASGGGVIPLTNPAALLAMLNAGVGASGGKTYRLAAIDFGALNLSNYDYSTNPIIIEGQAGTQVQWIVLTNCQGITWGPLINGYDHDLGSNDETFGTHNCQHIVWNNVTAITTEPIGGPLGGVAFFVRDGNYTTIIGTVGTPTAKGHGSGIVAYETDHVSVQGYSNYNIEADGIFIRGVTNMTVNQYLGYDFYPQPADHPDGLQWSSTGITSDNIVVTNSMIFQGLGAQSQGFFGEYANNVTLDTCAVWGGLLNSVAPVGGVGCTINNTFSQNYAAPGTRILVRGGTVNAVLTLNTSGSIGNYPPEGPYPGYSETGSVIIGGASGPTDYALLDPFLAANPLIPPRPY